MAPFTFFTSFRLPRFFMVTAWYVRVIYRVKHKVRDAWHAVHTRAHGPAVTRERTAARPPGRPAPFDTPRQDPKAPGLSQCQTAVRLFEKTKTFAGPLLHRLPQSWVRWFLSPAGLSGPLSRSTPKLSALAVDSRGHPRVGWGPALPSFCSLEVGDAPSLGTLLRHHAN
jgi:hypothetical protein